MVEIFIGVVIMVIFIMVSFYVRKALRSTTKLPVLLLYVLIYFAGIYYYFELLNVININLRKQGITLELGHPSLLVILFIISFLAGIINVASILIKLTKRNQQQ